MLNIVSTELVLEHIYFSSRLRGMLNIVSTEQLLCKPYASLVCEVC